MNSGHLQAFIEEAESYLPMIRNLILVCGQERNNGSELETALRYTQAIKDAATMTGFTEIGRFSEKLEFEIASAISSRGPVTDVQVRNILDKLAQTEALLAKSQLSADEFQINLDGFLEESFDNLTLHSGREIVADAIDVEPESTDALELDEAEQALWTQQL
ncbi:MAG TPA: Hpt domain-containing protein, partial [Pyrinomonadaceae bacterium]|nr:Hpt domain-containing protein [Pyrinomonadaceae bacterium]